MKNETIAQLGQALYNAAATKQRIPVISRQYTDFSIEESYQVQKSMLQSYLADGYHFSGRKVGMTSQAMRDQFCIDEPDYGYLFDELKFQNGSILDITQFLDPMVEAELAFVLKEDLNKAGITVEDVLDATEYVVGALEIIDARTQHFDTTIADSIADNASFAAYVTGDTILSPYEKDLSLIGMVAEKNGRQVTTSSGASVMGNPANAAAWLANKMQTLGEPLKKGEFILAGSFISAIPVQQGDLVSVKYGSFGELRVMFEGGEK